MRLPYALTGLALLVSAAVPFVVANTYVLNLLILTGIFAIFALSLSVILGYAGELSLGQAAFFGIGAYATALLQMKLGLTYWLALPSGILVSLAFGLFIGFFSLRLRGAYFAIITWGFAAVLQAIALNWDSMTGGPDGLFGIPAPQIGSVLLAPGPSFYYFTLLALVLIVYLVQRLRVSGMGQAFVALRENSQLAASVGIHPFGYRLRAFVIAAGIAALAGGIYAPYFSVVNPELLSIYYTTAALLMVLIGGLGTLSGPIVGAFIYVLVPEVFRASQEWRFVIFGLILMLSILFMPQGIVRVFERLVGWTSAKGSRGVPGAATGEEEQPPRQTRVGGPHD
jgi:branched-chain amino acid transport system permease protein